jgi:hypothetical protein
LLTGLLEINEPWLACQQVDSQDLHAALTGDTTFEGVFAGIVASSWLFIVDEKIRMRID